jgi:hypothetical protein
MKMALHESNERATIAQALALVVPKSWRYTLSVRNHGDPGIDD